MIVEFRIPLPIQVSDFEIAQLFMITKLQENVTGGGEGVIILKNEPFICERALILGLTTPMVTWVFLLLVGLLYPKQKVSTR